MFANYIKIALRNILKQSTYSFINIFGLTIGIAAFLIILIACVNYINMAIARSFRRSKEVGIRKVYGSNVPQLLKLIVKDFVVLIFIAGVIASAFAWYFMDKALETFAYRINLSWYFFAGAILVALVIALMTILYHSIKAAQANPVDTLRYE